MNWRMVMAMLHSNGQLRTEKDGHTEKGCHKPVVQQKTADDLIRTTHGVLVVDSVSFYALP